MMKENTKLCDRCGRPLWEGRCTYCKGYIDGVNDTKKRKVNKEVYISTPNQPLE